MNTTHEDTAPRYFARVDARGKHGFAVVEDRVTGDNPEVFTGPEAADKAAAAAAAMNDALAAARPAGPVIDEGMPEIMSMTEVAALYEVSRQTVHQLIMSGKLPARQAGNTWVIRRTVAEGAAIGGDTAIDGEFHCPGEVAFGHGNRPVCGWNGKGTHGPHYYGRAAVDTPID